MGSHLAALGQRIKQLVGLGSSLAASDSENP